MVSITTCRTILAGEVHVWPPLAAAGRMPVAGLTSFCCKSFATRQEDKPHLRNNLFLATCRMR